MVAKKYQNPKGGLNEKGRKHFERKDGGNLKSPLKTGTSPRRVSFACRFAGMKGAMKDDKGRPTRKARLLFICRNINNASFTTFVKKDVEATIAFIDIFQKGTHDIDPVFSPNHLMTIKSKAESTLKFLLEIHFNANN